MKKIFLALIFIAVVGFGCNIESPDFPDFLYTAVYFPHQYPVRTLSLGEDRIDNSLDRELKFNIGVSIGGLRENTQDWNVGITVDPSLLADLKQANGDTLMAMPTEYYSLASNTAITIPSGDFNGLVEVQLSENFLNDSMAWGEGGLYVIPLKITDAETDSILSGKPNFEGADKRVTSEWDSKAPPKDFTLFAVKYVNEYHGTWLHRGIDYVFDSEGNPTDTLVFSADFVVRDQLWTLTTNGRNEVVTSGAGVLTTDGNDVYGLKLSVSGNNVNIEGVENNLITLTEGSGSYVVDGDEWGGERRDAFHLSYKFTDESGMVHEVTDTLVYRDRNLVFEVFDPEVVD